MDRTNNEKIIKEIINNNYYKNNKNKKIEIENKVHDKIKETKNSFIQDFYIKLKKQLYIVDKLNENEYNSILNKDFLNSKNGEYLIDFDKINQNQKDTIMKIVEKLYDSLNQDLSKYEHIDFRNTYRFTNEDEEKDFLTSIRTYLRTKFIPLGRVNPLHFFNNSSISENDTEIENDFIKYIIDTNYSYNDDILIYFIVLVLKKIYHCSNKDIEAILNRHGLNIEQIEEEYSIGDEKDKKNILHNINYNDNNELFHRILKLNPEDNDLDIIQSIIYYNYYKDSSKEMMEILIFYLYEKLKDENNNNKKYYKKLLKQVYVLTILKNDSILNKNFLQNDKNNENNYFKNQVNQQKFNTLNTKILKILTNGNKDNEKTKIYKSIKNDFDSFKNNTINFKDFTYTEERRNSSNNQQNSSNNQQNSSNNQRYSSNNQRYSSNNQQNSSNNQRYSSNNQRYSSNNQQNSSNNQQNSSNNQQNSSNNQQNSSNNQQNSSNNQQNSKPPKKRVKVNNSFSNSLNQILKKNTLDNDILYFLVLVLKDIFNYDIRDITKIFEGKDIESILYTFSLGNDNGKQNILKILKNTNTNIEVIIELCNLILENYPNTNNPIKDYSRKINVLRNYLYLKQKDLSSFEYKNKIYKLLDNNNNLLDYDDTSSTNSPKSLQRINNNSKILKDIITKIGHLKHQKDLEIGTSSSLGKGNIITLTKYGITKKTNF